MKVLVYTQQTSLRNNKIEFNFTPVCLKIINKNNKALNQNLKIIACCC